MLSPKSEDASNEHDRDPNANGTVIGVSVLAIEDCSRRGEQSTSLRRDISPLIRSDENQRLVVEPLIRLFPRSNSSLEVRQHTRATGDRVIEAMSLWVDKHRPRQLDKLSYHDNITKSLASLARSTDFPHLLVYGPVCFPHTTTPQRTVSQRLRALARLWEHLRGVDGLQDKRTDCR